MENIKNICEFRGDEIADDIKKEYRKRGVKVSVKMRRILSDRIIYEIKLKGTTKIEQVNKYLSAVQFALKLPLFQTFKKGFTIYASVSENEIVYRQLQHILNEPRYRMTMKKMKLPYIVGYDITGSIIIIDLADFVHLLVGGSTDSGKTVSLKNLILSLISCKSPKSVQLLLIDIAANNLMVFDDIPHLCCPVVRDKETALRALQALTKEMQRRIDLEIMNLEEFKILPHIVCVIDESIRLVSCTNSQSKQTVEIISSLLQTGRHAKVHIVMAAQNPTLQNIKVDLGNAVARIAFRCAKHNYSMTILDEGGAEKLTSKGEMLLRLPNHDELLYAKGVYISTASSRKLIHQALNRHKHLENPEGFYIDNEKALEELNNPFSVAFTRNRESNSNSKNEKRLADIIVWVLTQHEVSCNLIKDTFGMGWSKANKFINKMLEFGVVEDLESKLRRSVLPSNVEELSEESLKLLNQYGYTYEHIQAAIGRRNNKMQGYSIGGLTK
jgi:S-DNA-T family DNA segregation ATPase FtsK/SpoIIIE